MTFIVKVHSSQRGRLVCVTDASLIGKKFEDGNRQLDFSSSFYKGEQKSPEIAKRILTSAYIATFSGQESVNLGKALGLVDESAILVISGVPQIQCLLG